MAGLTLDYLYLSEVVEQCEYVDIAWGNMQASLAGPHPPGAVFWYSVQSFLVATANISRIVWPQDKRHSARGQRLRRLLAIDDDSPLRNRRFRNHFEHYDERIQEWFESARPPGFADRCIGGNDSFGGGLNKPHYMRNFNPQTQSLYFRGDEYELLPVIEAVHSLSSRAQRAREAEQAGMLGRV